MVTNFRGKSHLAHTRFHPGLARQEAHPTCGPRLPCTHASFKLTTQHWGFLFGDTRPLTSVGIWCQATQGELGLGVFWLEKTSLFNQLDRLLVAAPATTLRNSLKIRLTQGKAEKRERKEQGTEMGTGGGGEKRRQVWEREMPDDDVCISESSQPAPHFSNLCYRTKTKNVKGGTWRKKRRG